MTGVAVLLLVLALGAVSLAWTAIALASPGLARHGTPSHAAASAGIDPQATGVLRR